MRCLVPVSSQQSTRVFVSSTDEDFRDLGSALRYWLDSLGYRNFMSEYSGSDKAIGQ